MKQEGNKKFESLYHAHKQKVYRLCKVLIYDQSQVNDLFQEVMINVWKSLSGFKGKSKIDTWIYRVTVNTSITFNQRQKRISQQEEKYIQNLPPADIKTNESLVRLMEAIQHLNSAERAIVGFFLEGFSYKEIAEILGISVNNVGVKLNRIKTKLKNTIKK